MIRRISGRLSNAGRDCLQAAIVIISFYVYSDPEYNDGKRGQYPFFQNVHPDQVSLFNTNARKNETFDHVAFFIDKNEAGLPLDTKNQQAGQSGPNGYDYGVFDFSELFAQAIHGKSFFEFSKNTDQ